jgi:hypothetical protein
MPHISSIVSVSSCNACHAGFLSTDFKHLRRQSTIFALQDPTLIVLDYYWLENAYYFHNYGINWDRKSEDLFARYPNLEMIVLPITASSSPSDSGYPWEHKWRDSFEHLSFYMDNGLSERLHPLVVATLHEDAEEALCGIRRTHDSQIQRVNGFMVILRTKTKCRNGKYRAALETEQEIFAAKVRLAYWSFSTMPSCRNTVVSQPSTEEQKRSMPAVAFKVGDVVAGNWRKKGRFYNGVITYVHLSGNYNIQYDDGDIEGNIPKEDVRQCEPLYERQRTQMLPESTFRGARWKTGCTVQAKYNNRGKKYYPGTVTYVDKNGTYNIQYLDGDVGAYVSPWCVRISKAS